MATIQVGNGWYNPDRGIFTTYDPNTGQLVSRELASNMFSQRNSPQLLQQLQSGNIQGLFHDMPGGLGGRSNVNLSQQVSMATRKIMEQYPQMRQEDALRYANQWVNDRIAMGWDSNQIENFTKDITRDDKSFNEDMFKGINSMISQDEFKSMTGNETGASMQPMGDPRGSIQDELRAFAGRMMSVLPPNSPQVQRIAEMAAAAGNKYATQSGMGPGGITATGVGNTTARALVDLQTQRESIGANALAAAGNQQLSVDQLNTQLQQNQQQANTLQGSNIGGMIGAGAGLIGGIVGSAYTGGSMAPAIPGLIQAGGSAGQAIGGIGANAAQGPINYGGAGAAPRSRFAGRKWGVS